MDLSRRRFLGASGAAALTAGAVLGAPASSAAAAPMYGATETAVIARLAKLAAVFPLPFPGRGDKAAERIANADLAQLTADFSRFRQQRLRMAIRRLAPFTRSSDERLLRALAQFDPAELVPAVAIAAHLVTGRSDPGRDDGATLWLAAVRRRAGQEGGR
jgi:hypothetical protein